MLLMLRDNLSDRHYLPKFETLILVDSQCRLSRTFGKRSEGECLLL